MQDYVVGEATLDVAGTSCSKRIDAGLKLG